MELVSETTSADVLRNLTKTTEVVISKREDNSSLDERNKERSMELTSLKDVKSINGKVLHQASNSDDTSKDTASDTNADVQVGRRRELPNGELGRDGAANTIGTSNKLCV